VVESIRSGAAIREIAACHTVQFIKYAKGIRETVSLLQAPQKREDWVPRFWQSGVIILCEKKADPRRIHWYVDTEGGYGKSELCQFLVRNKGAICFGAGKNDRIQHGYESQEIVLFDLPRATKTDGDHDYVPYVAIEAIKNGCVQKMYGQPPLIADTPIVLVFSNFEPDYSKLSEDRWDMYHLNDPAQRAPVFTMIQNDTTDFDFDFGEDTIATQIEEELPIIYAPPSVIARGFSPAVKLTRQNAFILEDSQDESNIPSPPSILHELAKRRYSTSFYEDLFDDLDDFDKERAAQMEDDEFYEFLDSVQSEYERGRKKARKFIEITKDRTRVVPEEDS